MSTISGLNFAVAKGFCEVLFGDNVFKIEKNEKESRYDVYLRKMSDKESIKNLKKKYPNFHVHVIQSEEV